MAVRKNPFHNHEAREKIRTTQLINRLQQFALDELEPGNQTAVELTKNKIAAIKILLDKALPNLQSVEATGADGGALQINVLRLSEARAQAEELQIRHVKTEGIGG